MKFSNHADVRLRQRGITDDQIKLIMEHGKATFRPGGVREFRISRRVKSSLITELKRTIQLLDKVPGTVVLQGTDGTIITAYHAQ